VAADAHAGIVDEDVESGDQVQRRLGQPVRLAHARQIGRNTPGLDAERAHCGGGLLDRLLLASGDDDIGALTGQPFGNRAPDAAGTAGDEGGLTGQTASR
jgi:hypothetical protein